MLIWLVYSRECWKRITANVTVIVNSPTELQMIFYRWYVIFIDAYTNQQIKKTDDITYGFHISDILNLPMKIPMEWSD